MTTWVNRSPVTVTPAAGSASTPLTFTAASAGNLLVGLFEASAVVTMPAGWTRRVQALSNTEMTVWSKTATAGEASAAATVSAPDYPLTGIIYEFPAGTSVPVGVSATAQPFDSDNPTLSGLTGTNTVFALYGIAALSAVTAATVNWTSTPPTTSDYTAWVTSASTTGALISVGYSDGWTAATYTPTAQFVSTGNFGVNTERITFAVTVPGGLLTAVKATATGTARPPVVTGQNASGAAVTAVRAIGSGTAPSPVVSLDQVTVGGGPATAAVAARPPAVTGSAAVNKTVTAVRATATAQARRPSVFSNVSLAAGPQFVAPDGTQAILRGWWDGTTIQPVTVAGYWDGTGKHALS